MQFKDITEPLNESEDGYTRQGSNLGWSKVAKASMVLGLGALVGSTCSYLDIPEKSAVQDESLIEAFTPPSSCVFPFSYKGTEYNRCTDAAENGRYWCSKTYGEYDGKYMWCNNGGANPKPDLLNYYRKMDQK